MKSIGPIKVSSIFYHIKEIISNWCTITLIKSIYFHFKFTQRIKILDRYTTKPSDEKLAAIKTKLTFEYNDVSNAIAESFGQIVFEQSIFYVGSDVNEHCYCG